MNTVPVQEVKRRGMSALDDSLASGPVYVIRNNSPRYVVMFADAFQEMEEALADARVAASEADIRAGRVTRGTADDLMAELAEG
jgi:PHD/YefM family antitoxin component YafN of YafNO toxin-antitoxin module